MFENHEVISWSLCSRLELKIIEQYESASKKLLITSYEGIILI